MNSKNKPVCELCGTAEDVSYRRYRQAFLCSLCHIKLRKAEDKYHDAFGNYPEYGKSDLLEGKVVDMTTGAYYNFLIGACR